MDFCNLGFRRQISRRPNTKIEPKKGDPPGKARVELHCIVCDKSSEPLHRTAPLCLIHGDVRNFSKRVDCQLLERKKNRSRRSRGDAEDGRASQVHGGQEQATER